MDAITASDRDKWDVILLLARRASFFAQNCLKWTSCSLFHLQNRDSHFKNCELPFRTSTFYSCIVCYCTVYFLLLLSQVDLREKEQFISVSSTDFFFISISFFYFVLSHQGYSSLNHPSQKEVYIAVELYSTSQTKPNKKKTRKI